MSGDDDLSHLSLLELYREETRTQTQALSERLLVLEAREPDAAALDACMRAAHSLKGAARIVGVPPGVDIAGRMEECFVAAQAGAIALSAAHVDVLLAGVDLLLRVADPDAPPVSATEIDTFALALTSADAAQAVPVAPASAPVSAPTSAAPQRGYDGAVNEPVDAGAATPPHAAQPYVAQPYATPARATPLHAEQPYAMPPYAAAPHSTQPHAAQLNATPPYEAAPHATQPYATPAHAMQPHAEQPYATPPYAAAPHATPPPATDPPHAAQAAATATAAMRRVRADTLNRLLSLSGESLVESRWLKPFAESMLRVKRAQRDAARSLDLLYERFADDLDAGALASMNEVRHMLNDLQRALAERMDEFDRFERRSTHIAEQLYDEALQCRMRPFGDATRAYPRIVRDLARSLGKQVRFSIVGEGTQVDRDILDLLDAPLGHLLRNAIDHGVEPPDVRRARGKPADARVTLEARHSAGSLLVSVIDDGPGVDLDALRAAVVRQRLTDDETAARLSDAELLEFLLLPGFSMRDAVTDVSGRGVGLDAVQEMVRGVRGAVRIFNEPGVGMRFVLQLPLTLSVIRSLLVEVGGEPYAFPLAHVRRTLELAHNDIDVLEGQPHFPFDGRRAGLVAAHQLLDAGAPDAARATTAVVVVGGEPELYGVAVDRFLGERMLVVQPLDSRLHKIQNIAAGALLENGDPVLIVDVEDLIRSVDKLVRGGQLATLSRDPQRALGERRRRVLVVDDSLTVRELERKLLEKRGYDVTVAVDGMDGWNAVRSDAFDLVVTDVDMPRMDGIELVMLIKGDPALKRVPVMIVSYKDRDEDRRRGLDAGADYYLAKSSFHDEALLDAVHDLIGDARG
ncbi:hybrid sensor histidine kinase/response regulator [Burkholderia vietnamiensis]|uniref:hybrid sensor histidine kinase/response regulator n=1 Tax=Burkholderia vietnamiensis TaxID=60552 RepID=UPI000759A311|nr:hybrid sensor histidine kinase/response regulator [Burkholderia vietnamiensis]KVF83574.1 hybrid sensor histidine kinase/response regulator [Burkholderia vietnamiensis]KVF84007.1 hybrid sensor histidine kinase/response regulator [Burkholderia vietnamiensis]KVF93278.1 hybrid sensor histidine kinase/response regulator [Burkholderia vietnamiensis]KVF99449.1 hybrid sensor histidine kinase/response regulator [Burkholderia vietnamiensis]HDR9237413.1 hybrid sensor histidine kinase/response regulato